MFAQYVPRACEELRAKQANNRPKFRLFRHLPLIESVSVSASHRNHPLPPTIEQRISVCACMMVEVRTRPASSSPAASGRRGVRGVRRGVVVLFSLGPRILTHIIHWRDGESSSLNLSEPLFICSGLANRGFGRPEPRASAQRMARAQENTRSKMARARPHIIAGVQVDVSSIS